MLQGYVGVPLDGSLPFLAPEHWPEMPQKEWKQRKGESNSFLSTS